MSTEIPYTLKRLLPADLKVHTYRMQIKALQTKNNFFLDSIRWSIRRRWSWFVSTNPTKSIRRRLYQFSMYKERWNLYNRKYIIWLVSDNWGKSSTFDLIKYFNRTSFGVDLMPYVCFSYAIFSVQETDWSIQIANMVVTNEWKCPNCECSFFINGIQRLQHRKGKFENPISIIWLNIVALIKII